MGSDSGLVSKRLRTSLRQRWVDQFDATYLHATRAVGDHSTRHWARGFGVRVCEFTQFYCILMMAMSRFPIYCVLAMRRAQCLCLIAEGTICEGEYICLYLARQD